MSVSEQREIDQRVWQRLAEDPVIREMLTTSVPRYLFWRHGNRQFEYTTERATDDKGGKDLRFWAVERRWRKTKRGQHGRIVRRMGFVARHKAKARAFKWYQRALAMSEKRKNRVTI